MVDLIEDLDGEEWKDVIGYNGKYKVSNMGRVKSFQQNEAKLMKQSLVNKGRKYRRVNIKKKYFLVHRLVLMAFIPINNSNAMVVNHVDHNPENNVLENLEWVTQKENVIKAVQSGHKPDNGGEKNGRSKLTVQQVKNIRYQFSSGKMSQKNLGILYGVTRVHINSIIKGRCWKEAA